LTPQPGHFRNEDFCSFYRIAYIAHFPLVFVIIAVESLQISEQLAKVLPVMGQTNVQCNVAQVVVGVVVPTSFLSHCLDVMGGGAPNLFRRLQDVPVFQFLPGLFQEVLAYFLVPLGR
jgi:hypothetical protein